jgi:hypothetical protein
MDDRLEPLGALSALGDPTRRRAYHYVCAQARRVGRDEVATAASGARLRRTTSTVSRRKACCRSPTRGDRAARGRAPDDPPSSTSAPTANWRSAFPRATTASLRGCSRMPQRMTRRAEPAAPCVAPPSRSAARSPPRHVPRATSTGCCANAATNRTRTTPASRACATAPSTPSPRATPRSCAT